MDTPTVKFLLSEAERLERLAAEVRERTRQLIARRQKEEMEAGIPPGNDDESNPAGPE